MGEEGNEIGTEIGRQTTSQICGRAKATHIYMKKYDVYLLVAQTYVLDPH